MSLKIKMGLELAIGIDRIVHSATSNSHDLALHFVNSIASILQDHNTMSRVAHDVSFEDVIDICKE